MAGFWSSVGRGVSTYFSSGDGWGDLLGGVLAGLGGSAAANREDKQNAQSHEWALALAALQGDQQRRTSLFEAQLADLSKQRDTARDRIALDTFGQFSVQHRRTPGYTAPATPTVPAWPTMEDV